MGPMSLLALPSNTQPLDDVACPRAGTCLAVGERYVGTTYRASVVRFVGQTGTSLTGLPQGMAPQSVSCADATHCWVSGVGGVYFTADLGASWVPRSPSDGNGALWSWISTVRFTNDLDGVTGGGDQCGGAFVVNCPGVAFATTDGGHHWTVMSASAGTLPFVTGMACPVRGCVVLAQTFTTSEIWVGSRGGAALHQVEAMGGSLAAVACASVLCVVVGYDGASTGILLTQPGGPAASAHLPAVAGTTFPVNLTMTGPIAARFTSATFPSLGFCGAVSGSPVAGFEDLFTLPNAVAIGVLLIVVENYHGPGRYVITSAPNVALIAFPGTYTLAAPATIVVDATGRSGTITATYARETVNATGTGASAISTTGSRGQISGTWRC